MTSQPPSYGPAPYGPPAPESTRGRWVVLAAILVVAVVGVVIGAVVLVRQSGAEPSATVAGEGYTYSAPDGWSEVQGLPAAGDTAVTPSDGTLAPMTIMVAIDPADSAAETPRDLWSQLNRHYRQMSGHLSTIEFGPELDGAETTMGWVDLGDASPGANERRFYIAEHDSRLYTITILTSSQHADEAEAAFDDIAAGWTWR